MDNFRAVYKILTALEKAMDLPEFDVMQKSWKPTKSSFRVCNMSTRLFPKLPISERSTSGLKRWDLHGKRPQKKKIRINLLQSKRIRRMILAVRLGTSPHGNEISQSAQQSAATNIR